jgi:Cof subfamily protein (haloacid dehalogenase superfamily)
VVLRPENVQAVATDVDGTILRPDGRLSEATVQAAVALKTAGIPIIVASARVPPIQRIAVLHPLVRLAVCCNGSIGYEPRTGRELWRSNIPARSIALIVAALSKHAPQAGVGVRDGASWILDARFRSARGRWPSADYRVASTDELINAPASAMAVCDPRLPAPALQELLSDAGIGTEIATMSCAAADVLDIAPPNTDKGTGLSQAFDLLGIDAGRTIAFGDAANDLPMFALVGHGVAMGNAWPEARAAADAITESVEEDGFANHLLRLGLIPAVS